MSGTGTSGFYCQQSSDNGSDVNKRKGITTSVGDNESIDNVSDASGNDDLKMSVNIDSTILKEQFKKVSDKMDQAGNDTVGSITHGICSSVKNMTYGLAV